MKNKLSLAALILFASACTNATSKYCGETTVSGSCPSGCRASQIYRLDSDGQCHLGDSDGNQLLCWRVTSPATTALSSLCRHNDIGKLEVATYSVGVGDDNGAHPWKRCTDADGDVYAQTQACP